DVLGTRLRRARAGGPRDRRGGRRRADPPARRTAAHRERELHQPRGARRARQHAVQQVRRGLPRQALLRRLRGRRRGRADRHRPRQGAVRRRPRQPAAALRCERQRRRLRRLFAAGRHRPRHVAAARRPPHARREGQLLGQVVQRRPLRGRRGHRGHRLRPDALPRPRAQAQDDHRRGLGDPAAHRLRGVPRGGRRGGCGLHGRRRPLHRSGRRSGHPEPRAVRRRRDVHHAQGAARAARRSARLQGRARRQARQGGVPDDAGRTADARRGRQGGQLQGVHDAGVRGLHPTGHRQRAGAHRGAGRRGHAADHGRHRHPSGAAGPAGHRRLGQGRRGAVRPGRHRAEQERHPLRPAARVHRERHPGRHAQRHDPGHDGGRHEGDRLAHRTRRARRRRLRRRGRPPLGHRAGRGTPCVRARRAGRAGPRVHRHGQPQPEL
ncbi:MAG: Serine hydroxymethyltransferase, partial [uncultured Frankineae bacterium]